MNVLGSMNKRNWRVYQNEILTNSLPSLPIPYQFLTTKKRYVDSGLTILTDFWSRRASREGMHVHVFFVVFSYLSYIMLVVKVVRMVRMVRKRSTAILFPIVHSGKELVRMVRNEKLQSYKRE